MYDVFLSHPHTHADWAEPLASRLKDECGFEVWLDKWQLIPGQNFVPEMSKGLEQTLNRQATRESFRVIPVLLPDASEQNVADFLELRTWVDFRGDPDEAFHRLVCGIKGVPPGRWPPRDQDALDATGRGLLGVRGGPGDAAPGARGRRAPARRAYPRAAGDPDRRGAGPSGQPLESLSLPARGGSEQEAEDEWRRLVRSIEDAALLKTQLEELDALDASGLQSPALPRIRSSVQARLEELNSAVVG